MKEDEVDGMNEPQKKKKRGTGGDRTTIRNRVQEREEGLRDGGRTGAERGGGEAT